MPKTHLRQPGFTYSACGRFIKNKNKKKLRNKKFTKAGDSKCIYREELDRAKFQHGMAHKILKI